MTLYITTLIWGKTVSGMLCAWRKEGTILSWKCGFSDMPPTVVCDNAVHNTESKEWLLRRDCCVTSDKLMYCDLALTWGDPHIRTLDKLEYVFNGLGEYWMIQSGSFELQARTVRAWNSHRLPSASGTVLGAVAARALFLQSNVSTSSARVHVEMPNDRNSSKISFISWLIIDAITRVD